MLSVAVETPRYTRVGGLLDYLSERALSPGTLLLVPLGRREVPGLVWDRAAGAAQPAADLRGVTAALLSLPPLGKEWRALVAFAAGYYQRGLGELALAVLPPELRKLSDTQVARRISRLPAQAPAATPASASAAATNAAVLPDLSAEQAAALTALQGLQSSPSPPPVLLHGATGSGKTEVYLRAAQNFGLSRRELFWQVILLYRAVCL